VHTVALIALLRLNPKEAYLCTMLGSILDALPIRGLRKALKIMVVKGLATVKDNILVKI
jgi:hypothetical protein